MRPWQAGSRRECGGAAATPKQRASVVFALSACGHWKELSRTGQSRRCQCIFGHQTTRRQRQAKQRQRTRRRLQSRGPSLTLCRTVLSSTPASRHWASRVDSFSSARDFACLKPLSVRRRTHPVRQHPSALTSTSCAPIITVARSHSSLDKTTITSCPQRRRN
ncbi:hypothetical protein EJ04DRAFT_352653 [Polyplosphaeria fusca]|uniref:Uncharacterized protein n=1 Tax=Polyplosphaeria fusca TaxID=682080 RepID=A0A9P4UZ26_9PLEO|nr:hypothetical protein EJ04DRAFT_352653 [Polyplosphaeria fusca]